MEKQTTDSYNCGITSIFHYDFVDRETKRHILTTKWVGKIHDIPIEGTSPLLNEEPLFVLKNHQVTYDGKKWVVLK